MASSLRSEGISPVSELEERSRVWRLVQREMRGEREPRRDRLERERRKMRPLLHVAPWRWDWESTPEQGLAKLGRVQFLRLWVESEKEE